MSHWRWCVVITDVGMEQVRESRLFRTREEAVAFAHGRMADEIVLCGQVTDHWVRRRVWKGKA